MMKWGDTNELNSWKMADTSMKKHNSRRKERLVYSSEKSMRTRRSILCFNVKNILNINKTRHLVANSQDFFASVHESKTAKVKRYFMPTLKIAHQILGREKH